MPALLVTACVGIAICEFPRASVSNTNISTKWSINSIFMQHPSFFFVDVFAVRVIRSLVVFFFFFFTFFCILLFAVVCFYSCFLVICFLTLCNGFNMRLLLLFISVRILWLSFWYIREPLKQQTHCEFQRLRKAKQKRIIWLVTETNWVVDNHIKCA